MITDDERDALLAAVTRDLAVSGAPVPLLRLIAASDWALLDQTVDPQFASSAYDVGDVVCVSEHESFLVDSRSTATMTVDIASRMADSVMDELNTPWPQTPDGHVLEAAVDRAGAAVWASRDAAVAVPIGLLATIVNS